MLYFTEEDRTAAFNHKWEIKSWDENRDFVKGLVTARSIRRRRKETANLHKNGGHDIRDLRK